MPKNANFFEMTLLFERYGLNTTFVTKFLSEAEKMTQMDSKNPFWSP